MLVLAALLAISADAAPKSTKIAVLDVAVKARYDADRRDVFVELLQGELRDRGYEVIGRSDIEALIGFEKVKDAVACNTTSCLAEIGGALGVDELITGTISKLSPYLVISLKRVSPRNAQVLKQVTRKLEEGGDRELVDSVGSLVAELYSLQYTPPVPRVMENTEIEAGVPPPAEPPVAAGVARVTFTVASSSKQFSDVAIEHRGGMSKCERMVTYLQSCTLTVTAGPARIIVGGYFDDDKDLPSGENTYKIDYAPSWPMWLGIGGAGVGLALTLPTIFGVVCQAPPGSDVKPKNADPDQCPAGFGLLIGGTILGITGALVALFVPGGGNHSVLSSGASAGLQLRGFDILPTRGGAFGSILFAY